ncbi:hypothetical protein D9M69_730550 [compost metagenome]
MARVLLDLPAAQIEELARLVTIEGRSRAAIIRDAIQIYISQRNLALGASAFGLWKTTKGDGLAYQESSRREWEPPSSE